MRLYSTMYNRAYRQADASQMDRWVVTVLRKHKHKSLWVRYKMTKNLKLATQTQSLFQKVSRSTVRLLDRTILHLRQKACAILSKFQARWLDYMWRPGGVLATRYGVQCMGDLDSFIVAHRATGQ